MSDRDIFFAVCLIILTAFIYLRIPARMVEGRYLRSWLQYADQSGLDYSEGSFFAGSQPKPVVSGTFRQRQVRVSAITEGKYGYRDSILEIEVGVRNPATSNFPGGAFFFVRGNQTWSGLFAALMRAGAPMETFDASQYVAIGVPINLITHMLANESLRALVRRPDFLDLVVEREHATLRKVGLSRDSADIGTLIEHLCGFAGSFESFMRAWVK